MRVPIEFEKVETLIDGDCRFKPVSFAIRGFCIPPTGASNGFTFQLPLMIFFHFLFFFFQGLRGVEYSGPKPRPDDRRRAFNKLIIIKNKEVETRRRLPLQ